MNESKTATFNESEGWHQSYIAKILANRAVIGEFQPGVRQNGKRISEGEPVKDYFPAIIDEQLFYRAQQAKSQRRLNGSGRKGTAFSNLFSGLAMCAYCSAPMTFDNKGRGPKGGRYLVCTKAKRRLECRGKRWRYTDFEASFLAFVSEVDIASILDAGSRVDERGQAASELSALEGELGDVTSLMDKTYAVLEAGGPPEFIASKLRELEQRQRGLTQAITEKRASLEQLQSRRVRISESKDQIHALVKRLQNSDGGRAADLIVASENLRHFRNRLNHTALGSRAKRYGARLLMVVVLEISADHRLHYHCIIDRPNHCPFRQFAAMIREQWWRTDFGYHQVDIQDHSDAGWTDYILKQRQKRSLLDSIDWTNCHLIAE